MCVVVAVELLDVDDAPEFVARVELLESTLEDDFVLLRALEDETLPEHVPKAGRQPVLQKSTVLPHCRDKVSAIAHQEVNK